MTGTDVVVAGLEKPNVLGMMCRRAFDAIGLEVTYVDTRTKTIPVLGWTLGADEVRERFVRTVAQEDPEAVFVIGSDLLDRETVERAARGTDTMFACWNPDNPFLNRSEPRRMETYLDALPAYDLAFIWSEALLDDISSEGAADARHLPFGYDPTIHRPLSPAPELAADVVFAGHWSEKRQRHLATLADAGIDLAIYGNYWKRKCFNRDLRRLVRGPALSGERYARALCSSKLAVNVVADHNYPAYNMRSFEIPATSTCMLASRTPGQAELFSDGAVMYDGPTGLREQAERYLNDEKARKRVSERGRAVVSPHSYRRRMKTVVAACREHGAFDG